MKCDTSSSGVESMSNGEADRQPPHKKYIMETDKGTCHVLNRWDFGLDITKDRYCLNPHNLVRSGYRYFYSLIY